MVGLGDLAGGSFDSQANSVSADGSVIVGRGTSASGSDAFRWTSDGGMVGLGPSTSWALGVSGDGSVIVGNASGRAFIWDATHGVRTLSDVLVNDYGLDLTGWTLLREAVDISADGTIIIGDGIHAGNQEAWIAVVPEPSTALLFGAGLAALALRRGVRARGEIGRIHSH
jgi:probable HAF family extracellular repeat protein